MSGNFKFVLIPAETSEKIEQVVASKKGGLERDELQVHAKACFTASMTRSSQALSKQQRLNELTAQLQQQGIDPATVDKDLLLSGAEKADGASVEILSLILPSQANDFIGVSMYCDGNGSMNGAKTNARATQLLHQCGIATVTVMGDAFVGKCFDNEDFEWERRDLLVEDVVGSDCWLLRTAATCNRGKNMAQYSTSGQLQKMMAGAPGAKTGGSAVVGSSSSSAIAPAATANSKLSWTQTGDDVEMQLQLPASTRAKDVKVVFSKDGLTLGVQTLRDDGDSAAGGENDPLFARVRQGVTSGERLALAGEIDSSESTWCLEQRKAQGDCILCITLTKRTPGVQWPSLLH